MNAVATTIYPDTVPPSRACYSDVLLLLLSHWASDTGRLVWRRQGKEKAGERPRVCALAKWGGVGSTGAREGVLLSDMGWAEGEE